MIHHTLQVPYDTLQVHVMLPLVTLQVHIIRNITGTDQGITITFPINPSHIVPPD